MKKTFGEFFKEKRLEKNITQKQLANKLFVSESAVSKWEKGIAHPDITLLPKLAEILSVTEHELITASIDNEIREEKKQAKKWRILSFSWSLFFYIAYGLALIPCFICDLAINNTLSWFWIVLSALILSFSFTNLPKIIKKHKLILIPLSEYLALVLLLGVCCIYTKGDWFLIPTLSVLLGLIIIFTPIYITKYEIFSKIRKYADFISIFIDFIVLNILLITINVYTINNGFTNGWWYLKVALPIVSIIYLIINVIISVRFLKTNKFLKTGIVLFLIELFTYLPPLFIKVKNPLLQNEINSANIFNANLSCWQIDKTLEPNIHLILFLSILLLTVIFMLIGIILHLKKKNNGYN